MFAEKVEDRREMVSDDLIERFGMVMPRILNRVIS
jgi:hypothetical protein